MKKLLNIPVLDYVALNQELPHSGKLRLHAGGGQGTALHRQKYKRVLVTFFNKTLFR
jgi:hypothetical protein